MNKWIGLWLLPLLLISCGQSDAGYTAEESGPLQVDATIVETAPFTRSISTTADLLPFEQVELTAPVAGNVTAIYFEEGQQVNEGDLLIKIDDRNWRAQLQGLQAQRVSAAKELERSRGLIEREGIAQAELEQAVAELENLEAQIRALQVSIDLANVQAPMSGVLGLRDFSLGDYMEQGAPITRLVQTDKLRVDFAVPAEYAARLTEEQEVKVLASAWSDTASATIYALNPAIDMSSRELQLRAMLDNAEQQFIPGDFAEVFIDVQEDEEAILIPAEAVLPEMDAHIVYKAAKGTAVRQPVVPGRRTPTDIQVLEGLAPGDTVIISGLMEVEDGSRVEVKAIKEKAL